VPKRESGIIDAIGLVLLPLVVLVLTELLNNLVDVSLGLFSFSAKTCSAEFAVIFAPDSSKDSLKFRTRWRIFS